MEELLTKQDILELFERQSVEFEKRLEKERIVREKSRQEFDNSRQEYEKRLSKSESRFAKLEGNWSRFVESLVKPGLMDLFEKHDIHLRATYSNIIEYKANQKYYEIDLLAVNDIYAVVVESKTSLTVDDVNEHLERLQKIQEIPPRDFNLKGKIILGAVAGISIKAEADKYAQKKGLFVLTQKGNLLDMLNPVHPREWKIE